jgi:hypothetical protein
MINERFFSQKTLSKIHEILKEKMVLPNEIIFNQGDF